ncbi:hypothetical protein HMPREF0670_00492 [Prevotella sp. oral taxon 317 str. F0108]|nr:hypothetical protein HMPREF0670_00492 [Prevotella sp. oral taxon 317 str. F0108]
MRCFQRITFIFKYNAHYINIEWQQVQKKALMPLPYALATLNNHTKW